MPMVFEGQQDRGSLWAALVLHLHKCGSTMFHTVCAARSGFAFL